MKNTYLILISFCLFFWNTTAFSQNQINDQDYYQGKREYWLQKAKLNTPQLIKRNLKPQRIVEFEKSSTAFQGLEIAKSESIETLYTQILNPKKPVIIDFGEHITGHFSFALSPFKTSADAPIQLKFTFGEVPSEVVNPLEPYTGSLSPAWLQEEIITIQTVGDTLRIPRRLSFRYVKIEITRNPNYPVTFKTIDCIATTSASTIVAPLPDHIDPMIREIDRIAMNTLKECMQTVFEDGPKRDQRLWIGDLYLQAMANNYSYKQQDITRRCLYLLAALAGENGYLHATIFEKPHPHPQKGQFLLEYALLFNATLKEYYQATKDHTTVNDLWPVLVKQLDIVNDLLLPNGLIDYSKATSNWWVFFDWKDGLHKEAALQGFMAFAMEETYTLAKLISKEKELSELPNLVSKIRKAAKKELFHSKTNLFVGKENQQVSYASQIWMILGKVVTGDEAKKVLKATIASAEAIRPNSPYLFHYYIEALIQAGLNEEARNELIGYWGDMVNKGADTFWEVYNPTDDFLSPYNFYPINSYCHAWSCTPIYFIRKYADVFIRKK